MLNRRISFRVVILLLVFCCCVAAKDRTQYFKMDGGTGSAYIAIAADGTYKITVREHVGVWVEEIGRWNLSGAVITFTPTKPAKAPYSGTEVKFRGRTFLSWTSEAAPGIVIPIEDTKQELAKNSTDQLPYVFFETSVKIYQQETKLPYPFRTRPNLP
jgi:hypothetical protein